MKQMRETINLSTKEDEREFSSQTERRLEKEMRFLPLSPFNLGANISLCTMAQWLANCNEPANLHWWKYYKRLCIFKTHKHDWHQIQSAEHKSRDAHVVFWHLKNAFGSVALRMKTLSSNTHQNLVKAFLQDIQMCFKAVICRNIASIENSHYSERHNLTFKFKKVMKGFMWKDIREKHFMKAETQRNKSKPLSTAAAVRSKVELLWSMMVL